MTTIPEREYRLRLHQFVAEHGGDMGTGFFGRMIRHAIMERRFCAETGLTPGQTPSGAKPSSYRAFIRKMDGRR